MVDKAMKKIVNNFPMFVGIAVVVVVTIILLIMNFNDENFYKADLANIVTLGIAGVITFWVGDRNNRNNRRNDCIEHLILEIEKIISDDSTFALNGMALLTQQSCGNRIKYLREAGFKDIEEDINFISDRYEQLTSLYSENNQSQEKLDSIKTSLTRYRQNINDKCNKIRVGLYS